MAHLKQQDSIQSMLYWDKKSPLSQFQQTEFFISMEVSMSNYYLKDSKDVLKEIDASENGLTTQEAQKRIEKVGKNALREPEKKTMVQRFVDSLKDPMILMLLAAAAISTATTIYQNVVTGAHESYSDLFIILAVVIINTVMGVVQESKAEESITALKAMTAATSKVIRDGQQVVLKSDELTIGDIIVLEAGDAIPADCRILESYSMKVEEAALTGESVPVTKMVDLLTLKENTLDIPLGDRTNMLYSGSTVVYGRGKAVVVNVGMNTEMGKIADVLAQVEDEQTPLQKKMSELSSLLTKLVIGICVVVFVFGVLRQVLANSGDLDLLSVILDTFILAVALAVAAIPEGLPAVVTIILSIGVTSMSKRNALIRKLTAVETLGCTQIICSDKTGTLTMNKMTVVDTCTSNVHLLASGMALCSDAKIEEGAQEAIGEPTEAALVNFAYKHDLPSYRLDRVQPRIGEAPFDSMRKMMSVVCEIPSVIDQNQDGVVDSTFGLDPRKMLEGILTDSTKYIQYTKGANEIVLERCTSYLDDQGHIMPMNDDFKKEVQAKAKSFADRALRVLGLAYRLYDQKPNDFASEQLEHDLVYVGFTGMIDPCRKEVYGAIKECANAGIRPVMITGDHIDTAVAIGKDLGIISDASQARLGSDLDQLTEEELKEVVNKVSVFARVQPEHKTKIVNALRAQGNICAMTGDGVNDAPSIKAADIGIGMGITGTDVTKGVADMVLADDNFATIVNAVEEGRKIYDNVRKVIQFQLSTNLSEVLVIFTTSLFGINIFSAAHLLYINMITDSAPGLALGMEPAEADIMTRQPRKSDESIFANGAAVSMAWQGLLMACLIIASFFIGDVLERGSFNFAEIIAVGSADGTTMAFLTCNLIEMFRAVAMRSQRTSLFKLKTKNPWILGAFFLTLSFTLIVIYVPFFTQLFGFTAISLEEFVIAFGLAFLIIPVSELMKFLFRNTDKEF